MSFRESTMKYCGDIPADNLRIVQDVEQFSLGELEYAIIFIHAVWSGDSVAALSSIAGVLRQLQLGGLRIFIVDNDCLDEQFIQEFQLLPQGKGEVVWVKQGKIVNSITDWQPGLIELAKRNTESLLA